MKWFLSALAALALVTSSALSLAQAASITSVSLTVGQVMHVTVTDQLNNPLPPSCIVWAPMGTPAMASGVADATGFNFTGLAIGSVTAIATYTVSATCKGAPANVSGSLPFTVSAPPPPPITGLKFTSP